MSKGAAIKITVVVILLVIACLGLAGWLYKLNTDLKEKNLSLEKEVEQVHKRELAAVRDAKAIEQKLKKVREEKVALETNISELHKQTTGLNEEIDSISADRDKFKNRIENIKKERDDLMARMQEMATEIENHKLAAAQSSGSQFSNSAQIQLPNSEGSQVTVLESAPEPVDYSQIEERKGDYEHWAKLLRAKANLEVKVDQLKRDLSEAAVEIVDLKQTNSDFQMDIENLTLNKEDIGREIQYKEEMINNLSLELARAKNDKKFLTDRVSKINDGNKELRNQLKTLITKKSALEKTVVKLTQDKNNINKKLAGSEEVIQSKIDEIWDIKDSIDNTFKSTRLSVPSSEVELPPIVVNSNGPAVSFNPGATIPGIDAQVVSVNHDNNFVILDAGENTGVRIGDTLSVYRDSKYVARLEVIQVRKDISAADIKDKWSRLEAGDVVR